MRRAIVLLNPRARRGAAVEGYDRIRAVVESGLSTRHVLMDSSGAWCSELARARREGFGHVIAVGGDGTVHAVVNALLREGLVAAQGMTLGAVGLGSSNDFHKPVRTQAGGVPVRLGAPRPRDVGLATWEDGAGTARARWFVVSGSIGVTARANRRFSGDGGLPAWVGARCVGAAIAFAAIRTIVGHENLKGRIRPAIDAPRRDVALSNLGVMLTPHLAGGLRYDSAVEPGNGRFALHLAEGMGTVALLVETAKLLGSGRSPRTQSWSSAALGLELDAEDDLELDGEVFRARKVHFEAFPDALRVCA